MNLTLTEKEFSLFQKLVYDEFGISLSERKKTLVQTRLRKWVLNMGLSNYKELYEHLRNNPHELVLLADAITTNVTSFFREENQWLFLEKWLPKKATQSKSLRIWSAACSSGQEPYTIAMFLQEVLPDSSSWDIKILATDLSVDILKKAKKGEYRLKDLEGMPKKLMHSYFHKVDKETYAINESLKEMILFRSFNLVTGDYKMFSRPFDLIFCRNVMIYFDKQTQTKVVQNLTHLLAPKGLFLIGHSESITQNDMGLISIAPSIYQRKGF